MNGNIHGERTASEPQDRSSSVAHSIEVPFEIIRKWQEFVNLLSEIMQAPSASIMRVDPPHIKIFVSSTSKENPCEPGALDTGPYCETVMKTGQPLLVPDALENEAQPRNIVQQSLPIKEHACNSLPYMRIVVVIVQHGSNFVKLPH